MRKFILVAGIVLMSATAHAEEPGRSLSLATARNSEKPTGVTKPVEVTKVDQPEKLAKQTDAPVTPPQSDAKPPAEDKPGQTRHVAARPRHRQVSIEARVIYELHRAGYYW
jgi:hypothetical protein